LMSQVDGTSSTVLQGKRVAFVGRLASMPRREAAQLVRSHGGLMLEQADASANLVVLGEEDLPSSPGGADDGAELRSAQLRRRTEHFHH